MTLTACSMLRPGPTTRAPETVIGTHTPVWYAEPFARMGSKGALTVGAKEPLSPMTTISVLLAAGS